MSQDRVRIAMSGPNSVTLENLTKSEVEAIRAMVLNHYWISVTNGRLEVLPIKKEVPGPAEDDDMLPFWRRSVPGQKQLQLFDVAIPECSSASIIIQHLCGYNYTAVKYKEQAQILESCGFECMRSRRAGDATYWKYGIFRVFGRQKGNLKKLWKK